VVSSRRYRDPRVGADAVPSLSAIRAAPTLAPQSLGLSESTEIPAEGHVLCFLGIMVQEVTVADINHDIAAWEALINKYLAHRDLLALAAPSRHYSDVRLALYGLTGNALVTGLLSLKMVKTCLLNNAWWDVNVPYLPEHAKRQHQTDELVNQSKIATFVLFFSFYESTIRAILRAVRPGACNNGFDAFASVYTCLLAYLDLKQHIPLLDFARTIRNTIHNNGMYIHKNGKDESLPFNAAMYRFEHGKKITFAFSDLFLSIYEQTLMLSDDLNAKPEIAGLPPTPTS
jgi:hypothetical protein